ncbi:lipopolysaccharide biosynthesis protein [Thalassorhabdus alkalitolerans]|uniref:Lipopolysaccharide biosynthesis protein n=1 Tax=Thalassorhabdus alkalitolerans TaxID=2282697 RepID=A0ABW0YIE2_9BACI
MKKNNQLTHKTLKGLIWSFIDLMANQGIQFIILIILARLLVPEHFGLLGMVMIFVALSQTLVDSGFSQALIREEKVGQIDYSTTFYVNLSLSLIIFLMIFNLAPLVSGFFNEPQLIEVLRVISLVVLFQAISIVPRTILIRKVDFKTQTKVSITASISSGAIAISMALLGLGVWSLIFRILIQKAVEAILLLYINKWFPTFEFSVYSFKKFFTFSWKLLASSLIDTSYRNIYYVIIGRMYTTGDLGYYTNAKQFRDAINQGITRSIQRVTYPVLSSVQTEEAKLKYGFKKLIRITGYVSFPMMLGMAAIAQHLIVLLMGEHWEPAVVYFQLLCVAAILYPMHAINLNILKVKGRSDLFLKIEILKKVITTIAIILAILGNIGVVGFILAAIVTTHLALFINTYYSGKEIDYGTNEQIRDLLPSYLLSFIMAGVIYLLGIFIPFHSMLVITFQIFVGALIYVGISRLLNYKEFYEVVRMIKPYIYKLYSSLLKKKNYKH